MSESTRPSLDTVWESIPADMRPGRYGKTMSEVHRVDIGEVLSRTDIVELIGADIALRKAGRDFQACCPFHDEKTPSFTVSPSKQFYHCFGCGAHGDALDWMREHHRLTFPQALEALAGAAGLTLAPEDRGALLARRAKRLSKEVEEAAWHETIVLEQALAERVSYRKIDPATRKRYPHIAVVPDMPSEREKLAAQRLAKALYALYGVRV